MKLRVIGRFRSDVDDFEVGQILSLPDEDGELFLRRSPSSFQRIDEPPAEVTAMSTETQTGLTAPDRRARGGRKR